MTICSCSAARAIRQGAPARRKSRSPNSSEKVSGHDPASWGRIRRHPASDAAHRQMTASSTSASGGNAGRDEFGIDPESDSCHKKTMGKESKKTRKTTAGRIKWAAAAVESVKDTAATAVRSSAVRAAGGLVASGTVAREKGSALVHRGVSGVFVGCEAVVGYVSNQDWISVTDPARILYAGTRGTSRGFEEARLVWESIPEQLRALGPEETAKRLDGFDWSHVVAQQGRRRRSGERDI